MIQRIYGSAGQKNLPFPKNALNSRGIGNSASLSGARSQKYTRYSSNSKPKK
jgi:hypothetical protein